VLAFCHHDKIPEINNLKSGIHGFRDFSPCSFGPVALGMCQVRTSWQRAYGEGKLLTHGSYGGRERERDREMDPGPIFPSRVTPSDLTFFY
jgi:hypothetical protein